MICTCTFNPSLDYYMEFEQNLSRTITNRSRLEYYEAGGKGINVSIVLNNLMIPTKAYGFLGGFTRDFYITLLQKYEYIQPNFTYIEGHTRINVKLSDEIGHTDVNAAGPYITNGDFENLKNKVLRLDEGDYFVLAGTSPEYLSEDISSMLEELMKYQVRVVLDTNPEIIQRSLAFQPFLIKTTPVELGAMVGHSVEEESEIVAAIKELKEKGAQNVIVVCNNETAILGCKDGVFTCPIARSEKMVSTVGTGDSLVAGFLMNYLRSQDSMDSFRFGCCCGSATAYSKGLATREKIESFYESTEVKPLD